MPDYLSNTEFLTADGAADWRLTSEGGCAFFR